MTLSACSTCKNAADDICLLGQSYIDIYESVQAITDGRHREAVALQLAPCSFWEESELSKQISREVTLSQQAWSRIAYLKLQKADQEMFASLISAARGVLHNLNEQHALASTAMLAIPNNPAEHISDSTEAIPEVTPLEATTPDTPLEDTPLEDKSPEITTSETAAPEPTPSEPETIRGEDHAAAALTEPSPETREDSDRTDAVDDQAEANGAVAEVPGVHQPQPTAATNALPESDGASAAPAPETHHAQPQVATNEADPIEQAMQDLWTIALASNGTTAPTLTWGRGSGRITETEVLGSNLRPEQPQPRQSQPLPGIA